MLQLINYSEKAVALIGDTREIKDELKRMGGKFNARLTCGAGWIFSQTKRAELETLLNRKPEDHRAHSKLRHPSVYCGTYGKYAGGSIEGAWIDLTTFANGAEAIRWMREVLHKDEHDPELMMQDFEYFPEWMYSECMSAEQIDEILTWWKNEGSKPAKAPKVDKALLDEYRAELEKAGLDADYHCKNVSALVKLSDGRLLAFDKPNIQTRFCFGYSDFGQGPTDEEARKAASNARTKEYFMQENLEQIERDVKRLDDKDYDLCIQKCYYKSDRICSIMWSRKWDSEGERAKDEDKVAIKDAMIQQKAAFEKRLEAWWKRYGADKLTIWTYWMDE